MNQEKPNLEVSFEDISKKEFNDPKECEETLRKWALGKGFELKKSTGSKSYAVYMECCKSGKARKAPNTEGKRTKPSKKTGNIHL